MNIFKTKKLNNSQAGQTLIETIVGIFMLVTAMLATLGTLQFLLKASDVTTQQVIAQGLASEGIDIVKNIRDSNWLQEKPINADCTELKQNSGDPAQPCYRTWLNSLSFGNYMPSLKLSNNTWSMDPVGSNSYRLKFFTKNYGSGSFMQGYLNSQPSNCGGSGTSCGNSKFFRKVTLSDASPAGVPALDPVVLITSTVWWESGSCPTTEDPTTLRPACKVVMTDYITNWKDY